MAKNNVTEGSRSQSTVLNLLILRYLFKICYYWNVR